MAAPLMSVWQSVFVCPSIPPGEDSVAAQRQRRFQLKAKEKGHMVGFPIMAVVVATHYLGLEGCEPGGPGRDLDKGLWFLWRQRSTIHLDGHPHKLGQLTVLWALSQ